jgi:hypothetical protein
LATEAGLDARYPEWVDLVKRSKFGRMLEWPKFRSVERWARNCREAGKALSLLFSIRGLGGFS